MKPTESRRDKIVESEAAAWAARIDADPDAADAELEAWLANDPKHAGALLRAQAALVALERPLVAANDRITTTGKRPLSIARWFWVGGGGLAAAAASIALFFALPIQQESSEPSQIYVTELGEIQQVALDDGSSISIDANTTIEVAFAEERRVIRLSDGRALFRASHEPGRPFQVIVGDVTITDIGTEFQVYDDVSTGIVDVIVTEGEILVESPAGRITLFEGQRIELGRTGATRASPNTGTVSHSEISRITAWRAGRLDLDGETLSEAVTQLNRANRLQIRVGSSAIAGKKLYGSFRINDPRGFADAAGASLGVPVSEYDEVITIGR
ncbi:FecR family protein [Qipengyuania qiaonensis]|uniref:FecR domain-containing protein n=1 Tax=Qipengyuania qiaonensis TaxID=2867240 RepID=A0ABS7JDJ6_9SPHN|nr:FecR domain-containing protein [Qipengyuania qiaonensis]MBX7484129.1 FecR domain-containing protein [Qipengyuania qiaonensis]